MIFWLGRLLQKHSGCCAGSNGHTSRDLTNALIVDSGSETERTVTPLGLYFWGRDWLLAAYCFLRRDYRSFRVDRIRELAQLEADPGRFAGLAELPTLAGYVRTQEARHAAEIAACRVGRPPGSE
jgi:hypothetical protein